MKTRLAAVAMVCLAWGCNGNEGATDDSSGALSGKADTASSAVSKIPCNKQVGPSTQVCPDKLQCCDGWCIPEIAACVPPPPASCDPKSASPVACGPKLTCCNGKCQPSGLACFSPPVPAVCKADADCGKYLTCCNGKCQPDGLNCPLPPVKCNSLSASAINQCPPGEQCCADICVPNTAQCVPPPPQCDPTNTDPTAKACGVGLYCCNGACLPEGELCIEPGPSKS